MKILILALLGLSLPLSARAQSPYTSSEDFARVARQLREKARLSMEPQVSVPTEAGAVSRGGRYPWKSSIVTQIFFVGEPGGGATSAWDPDWVRNFGGYDNPKPAARRSDYTPAQFVPRQNPFYVALPYNDVIGERHKPEAKMVIPWFAQIFERDGKSVCRDRWLAIRKGGRVCYAQWSDVGPFRSDHWQYVFGNERPKPNASQGAGISVSPAVRDFLALASTDVADWKFVEIRDVPLGPWARFGENNPVAKLRGPSATASPISRVKEPSSSLPEGPSVLSR